MTNAPPTDATYRDRAASVADRTADLLGRMSRAEKLAQLGSRWAFELAPTGALDLDRAAPLLTDGLGQVTRISGATSVDARRAAQLANDVQRHLVERTRLGIPAIVHEEVCSGVMARETTIFPQAIGVASTWRPERNQQLADVVRSQMRAVGAHQGLSPVLDICRDARWGRLEETYGEDPYLVAQFGIAFVRGLQGDDLRDGVVATAKHLVGYGASEGGLNWAPAHIPPRELREVYLHPFEAAVRVAGLRSVMNGYHELDGVPCGASHELLTELLRDTWGFDGTVVSDYFAVDQLASYHRLVADQRAAAVTALEAGIDVELPGTDCFGGPLDAALEAGDLDEAAVDRSVARVLRHKFELGLFEQPYVDADAAPTVIDTGAHRDLAATIARESLVLLRNGGLLPLAGTGTVAVIGPSADDPRNLLGDYTHPAHMETLLESRDQEESALGGMPTVPDELEVDAATADIPSVADVLRERLGDRVRSAAGCAVTGDDTSGFDAAVALAADAEVVVLVVGDRSGLVDACTSGEARDRSSLDLPGVQEQLAAAVMATGTPVVTVIVSGRPVGSDALHDGSAAVLAAWLPGAHGAGAIVDVLTGEVDPGGRLPVSWPRSAGHVPTFYGHKRSGGRSHWKGDYVDGPVGPRYAFGHGLSYTDTTIEAALTGSSSVPIGGEVEVTARVTNHGTRAGDEVVQLYVRDPEASVTRPVLELKGFARLHLEPGRTRSVRFELPTGLLGFHGRDLSYVVEPGRIEVFVGSSAAAPTPVGEVELAAGPVPDKAFAATVTVS